MTKDKTQNEAESELMVEPEETIEIEDEVDLKVPFADACVTHGRKIMDKQLVLFIEKGYDFAPEFKEMTIQLYLLGVIWRFAESLDATKDAREVAFYAIQTMFLDDRMKLENAEKRVAFLRKMSRLEDGSDALAVDIGYHSKPGDNSLVEVFDNFVDDFRVSGAFWRLYDRGKKTMLYGGLFIAFVTIWIITLFMPGNDTLPIFAAGLMAAALFVIPVFLVGLMIYWFKIKKSK